MYVTVEGYVLALARVQKFNETKVVRTYVKYECDYDANKETFSKDIKDVTVDDIYAVDEYDIITVQGYIEGDSEITEILQVFDWKVEIE